MQHAWGRQGTYRKRFFSGIPIAVSLSATLCMLCTLCTLQAAWELLLPIAQALHVPQLLQPLASPDAGGGAGAAAVLSAEQFSAAAAVGAQGAGGSMAASAAASAAVVAAAAAGAEGCGGSGSGGGGFRGAWLAACLASGGPGGDPAACRCLLEGESLCMLFQVEREGGPEACGRSCRGMLQKGRGHRAVLRRTVLRCGALYCRPHPCSVHY